MRIDTVLERLSRTDERVDSMFAQLYDLALIGDKIGCSKASEFIRKVTSGKTVSAPKNKPKYSKEI